MKSTLRPFIILGIIFLFSDIKAQSCSNCNINITGLDSSIYSVSSGQVLCIDTTGNFIGSVIINGGTICNNGLFNPSSFTFNNGIVNNRSNFTIKSDLNLTTGQTINNQGEAVMNLIGVFTINGGVMNNDGIFNVSQTITNSVGSFINSNIINCSQLNGSNAITNTGVINSN